MQSFSQEIATRLPNLVELEFVVLSKNHIHIDYTIQRKLEENILHVGGLRHLRYLKCDSYFYALPYTSIIDSLADNNIPIERLYMIALNPRIVESVARLTNIQSLKLWDFTCDMVLDLIVELPALKYLDMSSNCALKLTAIWS